MPRLNQPNSPPPTWPSPFLTGLSSVAHSAGVSVNAINAEKLIAATMVTENWR